MPGHISGINQVDVDDRSSKAEIRHFYLNLKKYVNYTIILSNSITSLFIFSKFPLKSIYYFIPPPSRYIKFYLSLRNIKEMKKRDKSLSFHKTGRGDFVGETYPRRSSIRMVGRNGAPFFIVKSMRGNKLRSDLNSGSVHWEKFRDVCVSVSVEIWLTRRVRLFRVVELFLKARQLFSTLATIQNSCIYAVLF